MKRFGLPDAKFAKMPRKTQKNSKEFFGCSFSAFRETLASFAASSTVAPCEANHG